MKALSFLLLAVTGLVVPPAARAQVPHIINYQGRITVGGVNFDGAGQFKFALVNATGSVNFWSHDGTASGPPATAVPLSVTKGLYAVLLGDTSGNGMTVAITSSVFTNSDVRLRVWFDDGTNGFQQLAPDQRIAAVGYALVAASVPDGSITAAKLAAGAVGAAQLPSTVAFANTNQTFSGVNSFTNPANTFTGAFTGNGSGLTGLPAANLAGTVADARLSANVALLSANQTFAGSNQFTGRITSTASNTFTGVNSFNHAANTFTGAFAGNGAGLTGLSAANLSGTLNSSQIAAGAVGASQLAANSVAASHLNLTSLATVVWELGGNAGTTPGTHFLGTTDNQALLLKVNNTRAVRLEPNTNGAPNVILGSPFNSVAAGIAGAAIGGGGATNYGGSAHTNAINASFGTVAGGARNLINTNALYGVIGGGYDNEVSSNAATVAGGYFNLASGFEAVVGGGQANAARGTASFIGGGVTNLANGFESAVVGGELNYAGGVVSFVGGGYFNGATNYGAVVGGGYANVAAGIDATVAGGELNAASGNVAAVGGGYYNGATGFAATVPGGYANIASGSNSFAAGFVASATNHGSFVWSDSSATNVFGSTVANQFNVRSAGGVRFLANNAATVGVQLAPGANAWSAASDRNLKENFKPVDTRAVLAKLVATPVTEWNLVSQAPSIRHIGPMAQDFKAAFGVGEDDRHISTTDADGVTFAAIQGLHALVQEKDARIAELERRLTELAAEVGQLSRPTTVAQKQ